MSWDFKVQVAFLQLVMLLARNVNNSKQYPVLKCLCSSMGHSLVEMHKTTVDWCTLVVLIIIHKLLSSNFIV